MYEIFAKLLQQNGVKAADVAKATGINQTVFSDWKRGKSSPKADKRRKIAEYFGVSLQYLDTGVVDDAEAINADEKEYLQMLKDDPKYKVLLHAAKDLNADDFAAVADYAERLRRSYRD